MNAQKKKIDVKSNFKNFAQIKDPRPKNKPSAKGSNIIVRGIKFLKVSSNCKELEIQWVPPRKKPIPKK